MERFQEKVRRAFQSICEGWKFTIVEVSDRDVFLISRGFSLRLYLDRDGVSLTYVTSDGSCLKEFALSYFLATKRNWVTAPECADFQNRELMSYALTLESSAQDILDGDRSWIKYVEDNSVVILGEVANTIKNLLNCKNSS